MRAQSRSAVGLDVDSMLLQEGNEVCSAKSSRRGHTCHRCPFQATTVGSNGYLHL